MSILDCCDVIVYRNNGEWVGGRRKGIGGSDTGVILSVDVVLNEYDSRYALWGDKTGLNPTVFEGNAATDWGHRLEPVIAQAYAEEYGVALVNWPVTLRSKDRPHALANIDFWEVEPSDECPAGVVTQWVDEDDPDHPPLLYPPPGLIRIIDTKSTGIATHGTAHHWDGDESPLTYQAQMLHYMIVTGVHASALVGLLPGQGLQVRPVAWDDETAQDIITAEDKFWFEHVVPQVPPEIDGSEATEEAIKRLYPRSRPGKTLEADEHLWHLWQSYEAQKKLVKDEEAKRGQIRNQIAAIIGDADTVFWDGKPLFTYRSSKDSERLDGAALKAARPDLWHEFAKTGPGMRAMRASKAT